MHFIEFFYERMAEFTDKFSFVDEKSAERYDSWGIKIKNRFPVSIQENGFYFSFNIYSCSANQRSASIAAMQPLPAAVTACR